MIEMSMLMSGDDHGLILRIIDLSNTRLAATALISTTLVARESS